MASGRNTCASTRASALARPMRRTWRSSPRWGRPRLPGSACLMAASRKRVTGRAGGGEAGPLPVEDRLAPTLAAHTAAALGGADILRAHDVKETVWAARMADALKAHRG